jgi:hypothetical protein
MEYLTYEKWKCLGEDTSTESGDYGQEYLTYEERTRMQDTDSEPNHSFGGKQAATRAIADSVQVKVQQVLESSLQSMEFKAVWTWT